MDVHSISTGRHQDEKQTAVSSRRRKSAIQAYGKDLKLEKLVSSLERGSGDQASSLACGDRVASGFPIPALVC